MGLRRPLIVSLILHISLVLVLLSGVRWSWDHSRRNLVPIEARLVIKNQKNKDYLPRKKKPMPSEQIIENKPEKKSDAKPINTKPTSEEKAQKKEVIAKKAPANAEPDFMKNLASLSKSFANELSVPSETKEEERGEVVVEQSYFDQIYSLVKESFVVPSHLNGPQGQNLKTVLRLFFAPDGNLNNLDLLSSSGDDHFDKAVIEGTKRVNNFGPVPLFLQEAMQKRGVVVELCPITCRDE
jgi:hypothetical protein